MPIVIFVVCRFLSDGEVDLLSTLIITGRRAVDVVGIGP